MATNEAKNFLDELDALIEAVQSGAVPYERVVEEFIPAIEERVRAVLEDLDMREVTIDVRYDSDDSEGASYTVDSSSVEEFIIEAVGRLEVLLAESEKARKKWAYKEVIGNE